MRKVIGLVTLGLGAFVFALAPLLHFYAYPTLAKVPLDQSSKSVSQGEGMSAFYAGELKLKDNLTLTSTRFVKADQDAQKKQGGNVAVWDSFVRSTDSTGLVLDATLQRVALDRTTAMAVNCCGTYSATGEKPEDRTAVQYKGLIFKFPMNTQKQTYPWWDNTLRATVPAKFVLTQTLLGTEAYVFKEVIPATTTETQEVPGSLIGEKGTVSVDRVYENTRTLWVEPNTGIILKGEEVLNSRFQKDGQDVLTLQKGTIGYSDATVRANVKDAAEKGGQLKLIRSTLPLTTFLLGLLLIGAGSFLFFTGSKAKVPTTGPETVAAGSTRASRE
jgi:Porin PorA